MNAVCSFLHLEPRDNKGTMKLSFLDSTSESVKSATSKDYDSSDGLLKYSTLQSEGSNDLSFNDVELKPVVNNIDHKSNGLDHEPNEIFHQKDEKNSAQQNICFRNFFRTKLFGGNSKGAERKKRIQCIMKSINSVNTNVPEYPADDGSSCCRINHNVKEYILLIIGILMVAAACLSPVPLHYAAPIPPHPDDFGDFSDSIKNCHLHLASCANHTSEACGIDVRFSQLSPLMMNDSNATESNLTSIFSIASGNQACLDSINDFFCNASYRPCDIKSVFVPSVEECKGLENVCTDEWDQIQRVSPVLVNCTLYAPRNLTCPDQFGIFCGGVCLPLCSKFSQNTTAMTALVIASFGITSFFLIISGIVVFVVAALKHKSMFHFPNVIILYITGITIVYSTTQLIPILGGNEAIDYFFCSHRSVVVSFVESTAFCQIYGFAIQATLMGFVVVWLLFIFHLFLKVVFPIASQNLFKNHGTKLYIVEVLLTLFTSLITPTVTIATDGFFIASFPPIQCFSDASIQFHGVILPAILITIVGISLILITCLAVHRTTGLFKKTRKRSFKLFIPEIKLMMTSVYLTVILAFTWIVFTVGSHNQGIFDSILTYVECVTEFGDSSDCDHYRDDYQRMSIPLAVLNVVFNMLVMFLNIMVLLFIVQTKDIKVLAKKVTQNFTNSVDNL
ncbi:uncharacterized protein [Dysidea avara]|uniref:uncharacterized protein isoform X2 n=1 Tax=Dysidea avara TaxID=196820 RepID=UPI0033215B5F